MELEMYSKVKISVKHLLNIDLNAYKDEQMRRRLDSWLVRSGTLTWEEYFQKLRSDSNELSRFRDYLTINVSEFFRDPDRWEYLRQNVLPDLLKGNPIPAQPLPAQTRLRSETGTTAVLPVARTPYGLHGTCRLRLWSAGCSIGPEVYTLAILLDEFSPSQDHYLLATDLDRGALNRARSRGPFTPDDIRNVSPDRKLKYFDHAGPPFFVSDKLANKIKFREHNLLADPYESNFDLIICRNVIIYFTAEAKADLYLKFYAALRPGGVLFLGGTEIIPRPQDIGFRSQGVSLYIKQS